MNEPRFNKMDGIRPKHQPLVSPKERIAPVRAERVVKRKKLTRTIPQPRAVSSYRREEQKIIVQSRGVWMVKKLIPIFLGLAAAFFAIEQFDSAAIRVTSHKENMSASETVMLHRKADIGEVEFAVIAITETASEAITPDAEVSVSTRASGTIRIINDYSSAPQRLAKETRFESVDGKIFMLGQEEVIIPGKTEEGPGEIVATVYASQAGSAYNIDVTDFSIPGFLESGLDEKYTGIYALSTKAFTGGFEGTEPSISEARKQERTQLLRETLQSELADRLLSEKTPEMMLVENTARISFKEPTFSVADGQTEGTLSVEATMYAFLVSRESLGTYLAQRNLSIDAQEEVHLSSESRLRAEYRGSESIDYENTNEIPVEVQAEAIVVWNIDEERIRSSFLGKNKRDVASIVAPIQSVGGISIRNHPRWRSLLPVEPEAIQIKVIQ